MTKIIFDMLDLNVKKLKRNLRRNLCYSQSELMKVLNEETNFRNIYIRLIHFANFQNLIKNVLVKLSFSLDSESFINTFLVK